MICFFNCLSKVLLSDFKGDLKIDKNNLCMTRLTIQIFYIHSNLIIVEYICDSLLFYKKPDRFVIAKGVHFFNS